MKKILVPLIVTTFFIIAFFLLFENVESFFGNLLARTQDRPLKYAALSFFVLASDIVLPVPSSIIMYSNGAVLGVINGFLLSLVSALLSSIIGYFIGRGSSASLKSEVDVSADKILEKYGYLAIIVSRGIPVISESICIVSGFNRYNFGTFLLTNVIGYIPICLIYAFFGSFAAGQNLFLISFGCSLLIATVLWLFAKKKR